MKPGDTFTPGQEPELAPGVRGIRFETPQGIYIPLITAEAPGSGAVSAYLDTLPRDQRIVFATVISEQLAEMLYRRGFRPGWDYCAELGTPVQVMLREPDSGLKLVASPGSISVLQTHEGVRSSIASADEVTPGVWWVSRVLVHEKFRGQGLGKELLTRLLALCALQGAELVRVSPGGYDNNTERQRGFYAACGFVPADDDGLMVWAPGGVCTCPDWWFPAARREALRKLPHGGGLAHHEGCQKRKIACDSNP